MLFLIFGHFSINPSKFLLISFDLEKKFRKNWILSRQFILDKFFEKNGNKIFFKNWKLAIFSFTSSLFLLISKNHQLNSNFFHQSFYMKISRISFFYLIEFLQSLGVILFIFWKWGIKLMMYEIIKTLWTFFLLNSLFIISIFQVKRIFIEWKSMLACAFSSFGL